LESSANSINNAGQVVGWSTVDSSGTPHAFFWDAAIGMVDLNQPLPGSSGTLHWAEAINDSGAIAANGNDGWEDRAYLLTPVPHLTPSTPTADAPAVTEGNPGPPFATFPVPLSAASPETISVAYTTAAGTATAGSDYQAVSATLTFAPGETSKTISVLVN